MIVESGMRQHVSWLADVFDSRSANDTTVATAHRGQAADLRDAVTVEMLNDSSDLRTSSDADLIASVREGTVDAFGLLYERHVASAFNLGRQLARSETEAEDLVADAFTKVLDSLRSGRGPNGAFRPYLLTALRHTAYDKTRREKKMELSEDLSDVAPSLPFKDTVVADLERALAARAFAALPERWQTVLWHTEIEGLSPSQVAPLLGITAKGVSSLAYRAREGLRQMYWRLNREPVPVMSERCTATADLLSAWTRDDLPKGERLQFERHLRECAQCRASAIGFVESNVDRRTLATLEAVETMRMLNATSLGTVRARHTRQATSVRAVAEILNRADLKSRRRA
ncbi:RNA polymerase sigma factor, sigma-70 family [Lentzea waywayandensis]|uniref:RNA polymerase sigma factor, sigma-70 family n=1 Tax=Lentzea waywayandensis TaxID=84724 RepID=A0A1I6DE08_9PSEU|nr:sigma-70 family RNA polymerase sigma factor [Lentzea waywayandensis]SFR03618.1 RNA polymerase sigma factor, sigma-70 family [Lentzea waywayandensis]